MAHMVETMAYAGETPWHGLGTKVNSNLSPDEMREAAGLDWDVVRSPIFYEYGKKKIKLVEKEALIRNDTGAVLTITSKDWMENTNKSTFDFFEEFIENAAKKVGKGSMEMHTAGSLADGRIVWALAKVKDSFALFGKKDTVESYLLFSNPHEYGRCIDIRFTPIRVVCNNTLTLAINGKSDLAVRLNHRRAFDAEMVKTTLGLTHDKMEAYKEMAQFLSSKKYKKAQLAEYFDAVFPSTSAKNDNDKLSRPARVALEAMDTQPGHEFGAGTWWQPFNAVTFATDHVLGHGADTRLQSAWYGTNRKKKLFALEKAVEFANAA